jgi:holo-ACP synthase
LKDKILADREKRYNKILDLIEQYNLPIVCGKINYPGMDKNSKEAEMAFKDLKILMNEGFRSDFIYRVYLNGYDGQSMLGVVNKDALEAKKAAIKIEEEHSLGRIFDIDVYIKDGSSLGREKISKTERKCVMCGQNARVCIKLQRHSQEEVLIEINKQIKRYFGVGV